MKSKETDSPYRERHSEQPISERFKAQTFAPEEVAGSYKDERSRNDEGNGKQTGGITGRPDGKK